MPLIQLENVSYRYNQVTALSEVSLQVQQGEFVAIIGPNGSGKSTLAQLLNALLLPSGGKVRIAGITTADATSSEIWEIRRRVGMVFQNPDNQLVATTVEEDVAFGPENLGLPQKEIRRRVDWALEQVGMTQFAGFEPHKLSGGQKQRVAIAGVLAMEPDCIVLDEPTAMLDPQGRLEVWETLTSLHKKGITLILITHFMEEAAQAQRIFVLSQGKLIKSGLPHDIFSQPFLKEIGLRPPQIVELAWQLREQIPIPPHIYTTEALVNWLCR
ncbi:MAG: energy-coupling factor transporter ATPase [Firmicutes bacterium]|jgi:energy-coupling factor transport system ATP-binding protein|nr:energy-coupling factor transporter ATPase [Bacillota bacterium]